MNEIEQLRSALRASTALLELLHEFLKDEHAKDSVKLIIDANKSALGASNE